MGLLFMSGARTHFPEHRITWDLSGTAQRTVAGLCIVHCLPADWPTSFREHSSTASRQLGQRLSAFRHSIDCRGGHSNFGSRFSVLRRRNRSQTVSVKPRRPRSPRLTTRTRRKRVLDSNSLVNRRKVESFITDK